MEITVESPTVWGEFAVCAETLDEVFFPVEDSRILPSHATLVDRLYCRRCPVMKQCRQFALACDPDPGGIWAGTTPRERNSLRKILAAQDVQLVTNLELDPEVFAPEPRTLVLLRLAAEDRDKFYEVQRYARKVRAEVHLDAHPVESIPSPIQVTVSMSQGELSLEVVLATDPKEVFPDPSTDLDAALHFLGIQ